MKYLLKSTAILVLSATMLAGCTPTIRIDESGLHPTSLKVDTGDKIQIKEHPRNRTEYLFFHANQMPAHLPEVMGIYEIVNFRHLHAAAFDSSWDALSFQGVTRGDGTAIVPASVFENKVVYVHTPKGYQRLNVMVR